MRLAGMCIVGKTTATMLPFPGLSPLLPRRATVTFLNEASATTREPSWLSVAVGSQDRLEGDEDGAVEVAQGRDQPLGGNPDRARVRRLLRYAQAGNRDRAGRPQ